MNTLSKKTIFAGVFGHVLENYDFSLYAFFSPILAATFFPHQDQHVALLLTFSIFALSFLVRPLGSIVFGFLGDRLGRKNALIISIIMMSISTFLLGVLPGYAVIGLWAPILLTLLRLTQGVAVSGEMTTAITYLVEHANQKGRGLIGGVTMSSACFGGVVASGIIAFVTLFVSNEQLFQWAWRIPFILGGIVGIMGLIVRLHSPETALYQSAQKRMDKTQKISFFTHYCQLDYKSIILGILLTCVMATSFYTFMSYFNTFLMDTLGHPAKSVMLINFIGLLTLTLLLPIFGLVSDKIGRKPVLLMGIIGLILFTYPIFWLLQQPSIVSIFWGEFFFVIIVSPLLAIIPTTLSEMFPVQTRNSGLSLAYNMSQALFGGTVSLIALQLTASTHNLYAPVWYIMVTAFISLCALCKIKESYQQLLS